MLIKNIRLVIFTILIILLFIINCYLYADSDTYGAENIIFIPNHSFENPIAITNDGLFDKPYNWVPEGTWYGRFKWDGGVADGENAVWSSIDKGGYDNRNRYDHSNSQCNGWSQELKAVFRVGRYTLKIHALGDNSEGLTSRIILGYDAGFNNYVELGHDDAQIKYAFLQWNDYKGSWIDQTLVVIIEEHSLALNKPIWIRFTSLTDATGPGYGNGCWWDNVRLSVAYPLKFTTESDE